MKKKILSILTAAVVTLTFTATAFAADVEQIDLGEEETEAVAEDEGETTEVSDDYHIGIVTGSVSQSEDDRRGAEAFQAMYGEDRVTLAIYPDNFESDHRKPGDPGHNGSFPPDQGEETGHPLHRRRIPRRPS